MGTVHLSHQEFQRSDLHSFSKTPTFLFHLSSVRAPMLPHLLMAQAVEPSAQICYSGSFILMNEAKHQEFLLRFSTLLPFWIQPSFFLAMMACNNSNCSLALMAFLSKPTRLLYDVWWQPFNSYCSQLYMSLP